MEAARLQNWVWVANADEVPLASIRVVHAGQGEIALIRTSQGRFYALLNRCPCHDRRLSDGMVVSDSIKCPGHGTFISLPSGELQNGQEGYVPRYPLRVEDGRLYLGLAALPRGEALG